MKRMLFQELIKWKESPYRKPLILEGARQVGKTWLLRQLAKEAYSNSVYCNFEEDPALASLFEGKLSPNHVIEQLSFYMNKKISAEKP